MNRCQCGHDAADHHEGRTQCLVGWCRCTALTATCPDQRIHPAHLVAESGVYCPGLTAWDAWDTP